MIKTILFAVAILVLCAKIHESEGDISLGSCSLSCNENEDHAHDLIGTRGGLQGPPGKRGPVGQKGERGIKGDAGDKGQSGTQGIPGSSCDCSRYDELATQVETLKRQFNEQLVDRVATSQQQPSDPKGSARLAPEGWSRASNNRWYKFFNHEKVNYETAKSRCAVFGAKLASAGLRTPELRSEIKRVLLNPITHFIWIGLDDLVSNGNYVWADGVPSTSSNTDWYLSEPSSSNRCVFINHHANDQLYSYACNSGSNYLCEI